MEAGVVFEAGEVDSVSVCFLVGGSGKWVVGGGGESVKRHVVLTRIKQVGNPDGHHRHGGHGGDCACAAPEREAGGRDGEEADLA